MNFDQRIALQRTLNRVARKHRVAGGTITDSAWWGEWFVESYGVKGPQVHLYAAHTRREAGRMIGMIPDIEKRLRITARACGLRPDGEGIPIIIYHEAGPTGPRR